VSFKNASSQACTFVGYPGADLATPWSPHPTTTSRTRSASISPLRFRRQSGRL